MNEEEEYQIRRIQLLTSDAFKLLKRSFFIELGKEKYALCEAKFNDCLNSIEELFVKFVTQIGETCVTINKKLSSVSSKIEEHKYQNKSLHDQLAGARLLLEEKNSQIYSLQSMNSNLMETVQALQVEISAGAEIFEDISEDSMEGVDSDDINEYESSEENEIEEEGENSEDRL